MRVLGINTGTSVDGVDMALVEWNAQNLKDFKIVHQLSFQFDPTVKHDIEVIIAKQKANLEELSDLNFQYSRFVSALVDEFQKELENEGLDKQIDLIGLHGQTVFHGLKSTMQIGNTAIVSKLTNIPCIGDFRSADIAVGGCGAPLTSFFDDVILRDDSESRATLNIGGIANISVMQPGQETIAYDTGPGNTLIDALTAKLFHKPFDKDGEIAFQGRTNEGFVKSLVKRTEYFFQAAPKSTGRELFDEKYADKFLDLGNKENIITTVSYFTAYTIAEELNKYSVDRVFVSGGGTQNKFIMQELKKLCPNMTFLGHDEFGVDAQYKEAILFSLLAYTCFEGIPNNVPSSTGAKKKTVLGVLSKC